MGNVVSKTQEWDEISERNPDNLNARWTFIFRWVCGTLGISASVLATYLVYMWTGMKKVGGCMFAMYSLLRDLSSLNDAIHVFFVMNVKWRTPNKPIHPKGYINSQLTFIIYGPSWVFETTFEMWPFARGKNKDIHNYLNTLSLLAGLGGLGMAIDYNKWAPIKSVHAVVGYAAMALLLLNFAGGFTMYVAGKGGAMRGSLKPLHKRAGMFALLAGMSNVLIALMYKQAGSRYDQKTRQAMNRIAGVLIFAMFNIYCCVQRFQDKKDPPKEDK